MRIIVAVFLALICCSYNVKGQFIDSIRQAFTEKPKLDVRFGARNSFITTKHAKIFGVKVGLNYNNTVKIGVGYNWLLSDIERVNKVFNNETEEEIISKLKFNYVSPYIEYVFLQHKKWETSIPVSIGFGAVNYKSTNVAFTTTKKFVLLYEPYMMAQYKFTRYTGVGFGVGYRLLVLGNSAMNENFNSPIYVLKFKVFFSDIYRDI